MTASQSRTKVFICYAHQDRKYLLELKTHFAPEERKGVLDVWDDTRLKGGESWEEEIRRALAAARVAICLVSAHFRASRFIAENELPPLLRAAKAEDVAILPVVVGMCDFESDELAGVQAVNTPTRPLDSMRPHERNAVWVRVVKRTKEVLSTTQDSTESLKPDPHPVPSQEHAGAVAPDREQVLREAIAANEQHRFQDAARLLVPLAQRDPRDFLVWFEFAFALAHIDTDFAVAAFMRAINNADQRRYVMGISDIKFPPGIYRYGVFTGRGSGTFTHGLGTQPDWVHIVRASGALSDIQVDQGNAAVADDQVVRVDAPGYDRWVGLASRRNEISQEEIQEIWQRVNEKRRQMFSDPNWDPASN